MCSVNAAVCDSEGDSVAENAELMKASCFSTEPQKTKCAGLTDTGKPDWEGTDTCGCLQNCGATDYMTKRKCKWWKCGQKDYGGMSGSIEVS